MPHDLLILGGRIVDGTGRPAFGGDVGLTDGRIDAVGRLDSAGARRVIHAEGCIIAPGFIDVHSHSDLLVLASPTLEPKVRQGVTTEILGQDGLSYVPASPAAQSLIREYYAAIEPAAEESNLIWDWFTVAEYLNRADGRASVNIAYLVPHMAVRVEAMGMATRAATASEVAQMQESIAQGMADGAVGLSTGLNYWPCCYATTEELIALCAPLTPYRGVYVTHLRDYRARIVAALEEALHIGECAGVPVHVSHLNHRADVVSPVIDSGRARGMDVTFDLYPYLAGCTLLHQVLPAWVHSGSLVDTLHLLRQPATRDRVKADLEAKGPAWDNFRISAVRTRANKMYEGKELAGAAKIAGKPLPDFVMDLLVEEELSVLVTILHTHRTEEDVRRLMKHPSQMFGSDSILTGGSPHPRGYGTFPRCLGRYVRELGVLTLERAIHKMSGLPARRFGLRDRGLLEPGLAADVVVFDPSTVADTATYEHPQQFPLGVEYVLVNGELVVEGGHHTGATPGRALRPLLNAGSA